MDKRICLLFFLFFSSDFVVAMTVPPVIAIAAKKTYHTMTNGPHTSISSQQLSTSGSTSLAQALQTLGGIQLQDMSGTGSQVSLSMRGFGANASSNTLLLINGIPITNPDMAPPDLNMIPLHEIESIEIIAGSESVAYGDQAVGGVINLMTRHQQNHRTEFSCSAGSYYQKNCSLSLHKNIDTSNLYFNFANNSTANYRDHNHYEQQSFSGNLSHAYQTGNLLLNYMIVNENMQYPGSLTATQVRQNRRQATNGIDYFKDINGHVHLQHEHELSSNWHLVTDVSRRQMQGHGVLFSQFTQSRSVTFFKPKLNGMISSTRFINGADIHNDDYTLNSSFGPTNNHEQQVGVYSIANHELNDRISLSIGARAAMQNSSLHTTTYNENINRAFASTIGSSYHISDKMNVYLRRAESFRFPKADENASTSTSINDLRTQRGVAYETGIENKTDMSSASFSLFQLNLRDEIAFDPTQTQQQPFGSNRNLSPTIRRGATIIGKIYANNSKSILINGQYHYVNARFQNGINANNRIPLVSENIIHAGIDYTFFSFWHVYTEALLTGRQFAANDDANVAGAIGSYTIYNLNLGYQKKKVSANLHINNIFNKDYYLYTVYQPNVATEYFYPAPDRNLMLTLQYLFD